MSGVPFTESRRRGRARLKAAVWIVVALAVVMAGAIVVDAALYRSKVHAGVSVAGVTLGGLTKEEAAAVLSRYVDEAQARSLTLGRGDRTFEFTAERAGMEIDVAGAVAAAMGVTRDSNFIADMARRLLLYFKDTDLPLAGTVDGAKMDAFVADIAAVVDIPSVPAGLVIRNGEVTVQEGRKGTIVDRLALREQLTSLLLTLRSAELEIPVVIEEPAVAAGDTSRAIADAQTMISAPVSLTYGDRSWKLSPDTIGTYIEATTHEEAGVSTLVVYLSPSRLRPLFDEVSSAVGKKPVEATFKSNGQMAWVEPGAAGRVVDEKATTDALQAAVLRTAARTAKVVLKEVQPELTTEEAVAMGISDRLGGYETVYDCPEERRQNVRAATKYAEAFVAPGERYNFDRQLGARTEERGFALAPGITSEKVLEDVLGGGICQVSTTVFNAVLEAGLEIVERHNHSLYIDHYPPGRDATVTDGAKNFQFRNDTEHWVWVRGWSDGITTRFSIYGTDDGREVKISFSGWTYGPDRTIETVVNPSLSPGVSVLGRAGQQQRSCTITRTVTMPDGRVLHRGPEVYKSEFQMITRIIEVAPPATTTTTAPATTVTPPAE